ncbi:MAG: LysM peptidoglycan-binding domain-containing protein [Caldilineae bacterium]|nr:MAG: LysM peptidoglycan-binding domain-containing protein [Caldilineae bacterium]
MPYLEISPNRLVPIDEDHFVIGADADCHLALADAGVARRHLILQQVQDHWRVASLNLDAPALLNGQPLYTIMQLRDGDELRIGEAAFIFHTGPLPQTRRRNYWPVAAAVALVIVLVGIWGLSRTLTTPQPLASPLLPNPSPTPRLETSLPGPEYTPPVYQLQVPPPSYAPASALGDAERAAGCVPPAGWTWILVQPGDTLATIAHRVGASPRDLAQANCLDGTASLMAGRLYVPAAVPALGTGAGAEGAGSAASPPEPVQVDATPSPLPTPTRAAVVTEEPSRRICPAPDGWTYIIVQQGDTLKGLALRFHVSEETLKQANCMEGDSLLLGKRFYVPGGGS